MSFVNVSFVTTVPNKDIGDMLDVSAPCPVDMVLPPCNEAMIFNSLA